VIVLEFSKKMVVRDYKPEADALKIELLHEYGTFNGLNTGENDRKMAESDN